MHPIERLRYVARSTDAEPEEILRAAAASLAGFADDPASLVTACRRLVDRHPANGPVWWLCARTLTASDPAAEAWRCLDEAMGDPTPTELTHAFPDGARVGVVGWPDRLLPPFGRRGDLEVLVVDVEGEGPGFVRELDDHQVAAVDVAVTGLAPAAAASDLIVLDATAIGPETAIVAAGGWAMAAVAKAAGVPVWLVAGVGRVLPASLWPSVTGRLRGGATAPWDSGRDLLPLELVDAMVGPTGPEPVAAGLRRGDVPDAPELRR